MVGLFRKKPQKGDSSGRRKLKDFDQEFDEEAEEGAYEELRSEGDEEEFSAPEDMDGFTEDDAGGLTSVKDLSEMLGRIEEIEDKMGRLDSALASEKSERTKVVDSLTQMDQNIRKLLSVYEIVSAKFNPFIDVSEEGTPKASTQAQAPEEPVFPDIELDGDLPEFTPYGEEPEEPPSGKRRISETGRETSPWEPGMPTQAVGLATQRTRASARTIPLDTVTKDERYEREMRAAARSKHNKKPLLAYIPYDYLTLVLVMRWVEFMFERVPRDKISLVLDYYVDVGWISEDVKSEIMSYARGEMQDVTKYMGYEEAREEVFKDLPAPQAAPYKKVEDWRLSADDHLKSLLFIQKIAGLEIDKDRLNSLEQNISKFKESLEGFHGV
ncbi:TPA: flagella protein [Thermoplasmata archaeon]|nr:flagella protein [Thermoplasmata archaeon]